MTITLADALAATKIQDGGAAEAEWMNLVLAFLSTPQFGSFPVSQWADGSPFKALAQSDAFCFSDLSGTLYNVISGGVLDLAEGDWLDLWGQGVYGEPRNPAQQEISYLWCSTGTTPVNLDAGELLVQTSIGVQFENVDSISLPANTPNQRIKVRATSAFPGSAGNVVESAIQFIVTPGGTGMTVSNTDPTGLGNWEVTKGVDKELDDAYKARLKAKWPSLALLRASTEDAWGYQITKADPNVRQWQVLENTPTGGQVLIYVDPLNADPIAGGYVVNNWVNGLNGQKKHRPLCTTVAVQGASTSIVYVTGTVYTAQSPAAAAIALNKALSGYATMVLMGGSVYYSIVVGLTQNTITGATGRSESLRLNGAAADVSLGAGAKPVFDITGVTFLSV